MNNSFVLYSIGVLMCHYATTAQFIGTNSGSAGTGDGNFESCRTQCLVNNNDSKQVCGTDGRTYPNYESLACASKCGRDVRVNFNGYCPADHYQG